MEAIVDHILWLASSWLSSQCKYLATLPVYSRYYTRTGVGFHSHDNPDLTSVCNVNGTWIYTWDETAMNHAACVYGVKL